MSYQVIARKWRPQTFDDVVGQDHVVRTLRNAVRQQRIAQAYLFVGPRGTGKTTLARIFAKALNCVNGPTENPCGTCDACKEIAAGTSFDVSEIDGASNNKVEDVHNIRESIRFAPFQGKFRICYIDEVHMLSPQAFNALLKILEEPPPHAKFIFATTEPDKILPTIISRCQRFDLRRIPVPLIVDRLRQIAKDEGIGVTEDALLAIARGADGGMRDAQSALDQLIAFTGTQIAEEDVLSVFGLVARQSLRDLAEALLRGDVPRLLALIDSLDRSGKDLRRLTVELIDHFRNLLVYLHTQGAHANLDLTDAQRECLAEQAKFAQAASVLQIVEILIDVDGRLRLALSRRTLLETALVRAARAAAATPLEEILKRLNALRAAPPGPPGAPRAAPQPTEVPPPRPPAPSAPVAAPAPPPPEPRPTPAPVRQEPRQEPTSKPDPTTIPNHMIVSRPSVQLALEVLGGRIIGIQ